ncbi:hypothetical protein, partial [Streptomyces sp. NPDC086182]|uniref:hypothetical protein n=1 Tax=Streptomyces sp. NPDC086182 TaxID=3155058 RepID=UPI00343E9F7E
LCVLRAVPPLTGMRGSGRTTGTAPRDHAYQAGPIDQIVAVQTNQIVTVPIDQIVAASID